MPQTTMSRWEKGLVDLSVTDVYWVERALELETGTILAAAGYVSLRGKLAPEAAILGDGAIKEPVRQAFAALARALHDHG